MKETKVDESHETSVELHKREHDAEVYVTRQLAPRVEIKVNSHLSGNNTCIWCHRKLIHTYLEIICGAIVKEKHKYLLIKLVWRDPRYGLALNVSLVIYALD